jgi:hypothetical protein
MKDLSQKGVLLFGAVLAVCAFAVPSVTSAASWATIGTTHKLFWSKLAFDSLTAPADTTIGASCAASEFDADIVDADTIEITNGSFQNCRGLDTAVTAGCTATLTGTQFPWTMTAPTTGDVRIHGIRVDVRFEQLPSTTACNVPTMVLTWTGTLGGGNWDPATRRVTFVSDAGTSIHSSIGTTSATVGGVITDTTGSWNLFM